MSYRTPDRCEIPDRIPWGVSSTLFRDPCLQMEQEERRAQLGLGCDAAARGQEKECCGVMGFIRNRYSFQIRVRVRATDSHTIEWYVESLTLPRHAPDSSWKTVSQLMPRTMKRRTGRNQRLSSRFSTWWDSSSATGFPILQTLGSFTKITLERLFKHLLQSRRLALESEPEVKANRARSGIDSFFHTPSVELITDMAE